MAQALRPLVQGVLGTRLPVRFEFWDGSSIGSADGVATIVLSSSNAVRRLLWSPGELGLARAFVSGDLEFRGDLDNTLKALHAVAPRDLHLGLPVFVKTFAAAWRVGAIGPPLPRPTAEAKPRGIRHSKERDAQVISHHYDVGNDFYQFVLGPSMTYSCARFVTETMSLEAAQEAKHDLICRKLGLHERPGMRLLDVGCGWGTMALHAASRYGARVVGITLSSEQAELAHQRVGEAGLQSKIEIHLLDYRDLTGERFDAISSIGMFEHVGRSKMATYFETMEQLLTPAGRLLNHAISSIGGSRMGRGSFIGRYVFPDGELIDVGEVVRVMEQSGFEVRDVESLREHYAKTLRNWISNLQRHWNQVVTLVGAERARVWLLYMAASANGFDDGGISVHQVLGITPTPGGESKMPSTRNSWS